jgi:signal transduction histidine kinase
MLLDNGATVSGTDAIIVPMITGECCRWPEYPMGWARNAWMAVTLLAFAAGNATAAEPKRVLLLHSFGWNFQAEDAFGDHLRTDLAEKSPYPLDSYEVLLEIARFSDGERDEAFVDYLRALFPTRPPDLIVTLVSPAARFIQRHRRDLFPSTPAIFAALDARAISDATLTANDTIVSVSTDQGAVIENIRKTLPGTTTIAVVIGDAPIERFWVKELRRVIQPYENRINFIFLNELSFGDMLTRVAALPPRSAIYFGELVVDAQGIPHRQEEVLSRLHAVANAPIFGQYDYQLGGGIVGGPLLSVPTLSRKTAEVAARILGGASPGDIKTPPQKLAEPEFDWRELRRWGIQEANLPSGSTISFREPTLWEQYRWYILAAAAFSALQGILIVGLLLNRLRLRRAHDELRTSEEGMSLAAIAAKLRFWVWDIPRDEVRASESDWSSGNWRSAQPIQFDHFIDPVHPDDRASLRRAVGRALEGDGQYETEYRVMSPDSTVRWIAARGRIEFDYHGKPRQLRAISIDITERRRAEDEARDLSGRLITAHEDERARLAHALHDDVTQRLALLAIDAGSKEKGLSDTIAGQAMRSIRRDLVQLSEDVHALSYALHPAILEDLGLIEALKAECARFGAVEGIPTILRASDDVDQPTSALSLCLYRVAQEALRNVARHSGASSVEIALRAVGGGLELAVRDNGVGFDPTRKQGRPSLGLAGMRQRLALVDGELLINSAPGGGTSVVARAPLKAGGAP